MITFIPRDIGLWRGVYHFGPESLSDKPTKSYFENKPEFISFLKEHGIKVNDAQNPLRFIGPREHDVLGSV